MIKKIMPLLLIAVIMSFVANSSFGVPISLNGFGTASVGTGGDYPTLFDMATDFDQTFGSSTGTGLFGDVTVLILNSITQTTVVAIGGNTGGHTLTIMPATSNITVFFSQAADNAGPTGDILLGTQYGVSGQGITNSNFGPGYPSANNLVTTANIVFEGSHNGTNSQDLYIVSSTHNWNGISFQARTQLSNCTIRNCIVQNKSNGSTAVVVNLANRNDGTTQSHIHDIYLINDQLLYLGIGTTNSGVLMTTSGTQAAGVECYNIGIQGCTIQASERVISLLNTASITISGCTIICNAVGNTGGNLASGITELVSNASTGWTKTISNNYIVCSSNSAGFTSGVAGIDMSSGGSGTWNIYNNVITGLIQPATVSNFTCVGIRGGITSQVYNIYNNSIYISQQANSLTSNATTCFGIGIPNGYATTANIENNIVDIQQAGGTALYGVVTTAIAGASVTSNFNDLVANPSSSIGIANGLAYATLGAYQAGAGEDASSQTLDPTLSAPAKWATPLTSLQFTPSSVGANGLNGVAQVGGITTDITGATRNSPTWPGAYDNGATVPVELSNFDANGS